MTSLIENNLIKYSVEELTEYENLNIDLNPPQELLIYIKKIQNYSFKESKNSGWRNKNIINLSKSWILDAKKSRNDEKKLIVSIQSILNKLSESNFDSLLEKLLNITVSTKDQLIYLVDLIYKKALLESTFLNLYGSLCLRFSNTFIQEDLNKYYFKEILIDKCQEQFYILLDPKHKEYPKVNVRKKVIGCILFIGELYNQSIIINKIILYICKILHHYLENNDKIKNEYIVDIICKFYEKIGLKLKNSPENFFRDYLKELYEYKKKKTTSSKEKFTIMDLEDIDKGNLWKV